MLVYYFQLKVLIKVTSACFSYKALRYQRVFNYNAALTLCNKLLYSHQLKNFTVAVECIQGLCTANFMKLNSCKTRLIAFTRKTRELL